MMNKGSAILAVAFLTVVWGYQPSSRRNILLGLSSSLLIPSSNAHAVLRSKGCYQGTGEACAELAENNDYIRKLQDQSALNRERNEREAREAYYLKNYPDWFASIGKVMIKKPDGSFMVMTAEEAEKLQRSGKTTIETPKTKGGTIVDYTQKPIVVLKE